MGKKIIITENMAKCLVANQILQEEATKAEIVKIVRDAFKDDRELNKDIDKKVKALVADCVNSLFRTLWQRRNFYEDEIKK